MDDGCARSQLDFLFKFQVVVHVLSVETTRSVMKPMRRRQRSSQSGKLWPRLCGTRRRLMQRILSTVCFTQPSGTRRGNKKRGSRSAHDFVYQDEQVRRHEPKDLVIHLNVLACVKPPFFLDNARSLKSSYS